MLNMLICRRFLLFLLGLPMFRQNISLTRTTTPTKNQPNLMNYITKCNLILHSVLIYRLKQLL